MAILNGVNYAKANVTNPSVKIDKGEQYGRVHFAYDTYVASGAIALNDVIYMMKLPAGARVIGGALTFTDLGTVGALSVGWLANGVDSVNAAGFVAITAVTGATGGSVDFVPNSLSVAPPAGWLKQFSVETQVTVTATTATDAAGTIKLMIEYVID